MMHVKEYKSPQGQSRWRIPLRALTVYLLVATLLTTGISFARYSTSGPGSDNDARVAKWDVRVDFPDGEIELTEDTLEKKAEYSFSVVNNSEVAVTYEINVTFNNPLPNGITMSIGETSVEGNGEQMTFSFPGGILEANGSSLEHTFTISAVFTELTETFYEEANISVTAVQID